MPDAATPVAVPYAMLKAAADLIEAAAATGTLPAELQAEAVSGARQLGALVILADHGLSIAPQPAAVEPVAELPPSATHTLHCPQCDAEAVFQGPHVHNALVSCPSCGWAGHGTRPNIILPELTE